MAFIEVGSNLGSALLSFLNCEEIVPGSAPSYQTCKDLYEFHPHGAKMAESPIRMAQCQQREIAVARGPEERVRDQFIKEWKKRECDAIIFNAASLARIYGISSVALIEQGDLPGGSADASKAVDLKELHKKPFTFNVFDPLNTSGSLVLNQNPNAFDYQKPVQISVQSKPYHPSRTCVLMNERPIYISYTSSSFGFVGRSVYQRALFPMKSFIQSMITDDMVTKKAGLLIAITKAAGSIADGFMAKLFGIKREMLKSGITGQVLSINIDESIETLNMQNIDKAMITARKNILENEAVAADMPAQLLNTETFAEGFGEGTEDAKHVARYIDRIREELGPVYGYFDNIIQYTAWTPEFFETIKADFPEEYGSRTFEDAFYEWRNNFTAIWPNLLTEPDSKKVKTQEVKHKTVIATYEVLAPELDPVNKATLTEWVADNLNEDQVMFTAPLELDYEALAEYVPPVAAMGEGEPGEPKEPVPFARSA